MTVGLTQNYMVLDNRYLLKMLPLY